MYCKRSYGPAQKAFSVRFFALGVSVWSCGTRQDALGALPITPTGDKISFISRKLQTYACTHVHACQRPRRDLRRPRAALTGPGATTQHPHPSLDPPGAASEPPGCPNCRNLASAVGAVNRHPREGAAARPGDHASAVRHGPARSAHASHTPAHAAALHGRLGATAAAHRRRNGCCGPLRAPDGSPVDGASATHRRRARLRTWRKQGGLGRA